MTKLRKFNDEGIEKFRSYLKVLREDRSMPPPIDLLTDPAFSISVQGLGEAEPQILTTKGEAVAHLIKLLEPVAGPSLYSDVGLWSWLSLFLFESVCPLKDGKRKPVADSHYILGPAHE